MPTVLSSSVGLVFQEMGEEEMQVVLSSSVGLACSAGIR